MAHRSRPPLRAHVSDTRTHAHARPPAHLVPKPHAHTHMCSHPHSNPPTYPHTGAGSRPWPLRPLAGGPRDRHSPPPLHTPTHTYIHAYTHTHARTHIHTYPPTLPHAPTHRRHAMGCFGLTRRACGRGSRPWPLRPLAGGPRDRCSPSPPRTLTHTHIHA